MLAQNPDSTESFESWLLRRVAQAVEGGEVPAALLTELPAEIEAARDRPRRRAMLRRCGISPGSSASR